MKDAIHLCAALGIVGYDHIEVYDTPQPLFGYHGDERPEKAHVIVRRQYVSGASNDLGFFKGEDGIYRAIISDYDSVKHDTSWMNRLKQGYAESRTIATARAKGYVFQGRTVTQTANGPQVQLQFAVR